MNGKPEEAGPNLVMPPLVQNTGQAVVNLLFGIK